MFDALALPIVDQCIEFAGKSISIRRLDQIHPNISGNKFFKLKYNFLAAQAQSYKKILSFGGAYSNHIAATAYAAQRFGFESLGIIRGEELADQPLNHTLRTAQNMHMQLQFVSREVYRKKHEVEFLAAYPDYYVIPEGGSNALAIQGCREILTPADADFDVICCAVGTGGTMTGLIEASQPHQQVLGFSALKGDFLQTEIAKHTQKRNWQLTDRYCFGGYAKTTPELLAFMHGFEQRYQIPLEQVYTAKMLYGLHDLIQQNYFKPNCKILVIHSGGLQGRLLTPPCT